MSISSKNRAIDIHGISIQYRVSTVDDAVGTIFFIHGLGGDLSVWDEQVHFFTKKGYTCLRVDLRGHGKSDHPQSEADYDLNEFVDDICEILRAEKINSTFLIGHCLGGMISLLFALKYQHLLKGLVLIDTSYKAPDYISMLSTRPRLYQYVKKIIRYTPSFYQRGYTDFPSFQGTEDINIRRILSDLMHVSVKNFFSICENIANFSIFEQLDKIHIPTLIVHGLRDSIIKSQIAQSMHERITSSLLSFIPDGNHIIVVNNPEIITSEIDTFIKTVTIQT